MRGFCEALWLPGWSHRSTWGYDEQMDTYFAQLWRDGDTDDDPTVWISGCHPIGTEMSLARAISDVTDNRVQVVKLALLGPPTDSADS